MALNDASVIDRSATVFESTTETGAMMTLTGNVSGHRYVTTAAAQATAGSTSVLGVMHDAAGGVTGERKLVATCCVHPVIADDAIAAGQHLKVGDGGRAIGLVDAATAGTTIKTTGAGVAATNQPANDAIEIVSSSAADTTQTVTIIATTNAVDTVVVEPKTLNGTTPVVTTKTDWGLFLAAKLSASCAGTITIREASADQTITTITTGVLSKGVEAVTAAAQQAYNVAPTAVASGATTKQLGIGGTNSAGTQIYDSKALNGTTAVTFASTFKRITEVYTGDLEATRTAIVKVGAAEDRSLKTGKAITAATAQGDRISSIVSPA